MVFAPLQRLIAVFSIMLLLQAAFGKTPAPESSIDAHRRQQDARLNTPVTFSADRIYLGELLEALSAKTGVALSMDNTDSFSGILIACDLKQTPLADVMNSLWSLVGFKDAVWEWRADTQHTPIRYSFRPTPKAHNLPNRLRNAMQETYEAETEMLIQMAFLSPEERKANADKLLAIIGIEDQKRARDYVEQALANDDLWAERRLFAKLLSREERSRVLRGGTVEIPLVSLSNEDRQAALKADANAYKTDVGGNAEQQALAATVRFEGTQSMPNIPGTFLWAMIGFGGGPHDGSSHGVFGVSTHSLSPQLIAGWILPGDLPTRAIDSQPITALAAFKPGEIWNSVPLLDHNLAQLAATEGVSFMAVVPEDDNDPPPSGTTEDYGIPPFTPLGITPTRYFAEEFFQNRLMHKWREGILLVNYPEWLYGDRMQIAYGTIKRLRATVKRQNGLLTLDDVAGPMTELSVPQLWHLTKEFPFSAGGGRILTMGAPPQPMTSLCAFYRRYPKSLNPHGLLLDLKMQAFLQNSKLWPSTLKEGEYVTRARIADKTERGGGHTYSLQLYTTRQDWIDVGSFGIAPISTEAITIPYPK